MSRVSLAELKSSGVPIRAEEATAIVRELCRRCATGALNGIPDARAVTIARDGSIHTGSEVTTGAAPIPAAASLLEEVTTEMPGALRLVIARAAGSLDVPPFTSLDEFSAALDRFATVDADDAARHLYKAWKPARRPASLRYAWAAAAIALVLILAGLMFLPSRVHEETTPRHLAAGDTPPPIAPVAESREPAAPPSQASSPVHKVSRKEPAREQPARKPFLKRELFRIVIK